MPKNILIQSVKNTLSSIKSHPFLFLSLLILQILFIVGLWAFVFPNYINGMISSQKIMDYANSLNLDESSLAQNIDNLRSMPNVLGDDPLLIYREFRKLINLILFTLSISCLIIVVFNSLSWSFVQRIFDKFGWKEFFGLLLRNFFIGVFFVGIMFLSVVVFFQQFYLDWVIENGFFVFLAFLILFLEYYFMLVYFGSANLKLRNIPKKIFSLGIKKSYYLVPIFIFSMIVFSAIGIWAYAIQEKAYLLLMGIIFLGFIWGVLSRVFWAGVCFELNKN